jgi:hypothetical protein
MVFPDIPDQGPAHDAKDWQLLSCVHINQTPVLENRCNDWKSIEYVAC